jgi:DNA-directed RNA polymerase specialized sigma24 family protein
MLNGEGPDSRPTDPILDLWDPVEPSASTSEPGDAAQDQTFTALIEEHRVERLGPLWLATIEPITRRLAFRYDPHVYARSTRWDESALEDLLQDTVERLLAKSQVEYICDVATDLGHIRALLYKQVRFTLADRRQVTVIDNLLHRATQRLAERPFIEVPGVAGGRTWKLHPGQTGQAGKTAASADGPGDPHQEVIAQLRRLPRLPGLGTERASAVWTSDVLTRALTLACEMLGDVTEDDLRRILAGALTFFATAEVVVDDAGAEERSQAMQPGDQAVANETVDLLTRRLSADEIRILAGKFAGRSDGDIAHGLGISRPTVDSRKKSGIAKIHAAVSGLDENVQNNVLEQLQERLMTMQEEQTQ